MFSSLKRITILKIGASVLALSLLWIIRIPYTGSRSLFRSAQDNRGIHRLRMYSNKSYLIDTPECRIPNVNPFSADVKKYFQALPYRACSKLPLLTYTKVENDISTLHINESLLSSYSLMKITCCYSNITRPTTGEDIDSEVNVSDCVPFQQSVRVTSSNVMVNCYNKFQFKVYANVHTIMNPAQIVNSRDNLKKRNNSYSILLVGIDSISKLNLYRTMPKTWSFLESAGFINLKGYTKIDDNTFPNLMAILTGKTTDQIYKACDPSKTPMNECGIIWDRFRDLGYVTACAEDITRIGTFNYVRRGFQDPPTDFYFRPYFLAAEKLKSYNLFGAFYCTGPEQSGERVLNTVKDFSNILAGYPKFGLFWINTFSHNNVNLASSMDQKVEIFLEDIFSNMDKTNTVLVFFSDHGFRFGGIRHTATGWLEERQPFIYLYFPEKFKREHADAYKNLITNSERLTSPYDLYMTLQHLLSISSAGKYLLQPSLACPKCQSLLDEVPLNRNCQDAAILPHWCVCKAFTYISPSTRMVSETAEYLVSQLNDLIGSHEEGHKCVQYELKKVSSAGIFEVPVVVSEKKTINLLLIVETIPAALFEGTVERNDDLVKSRSEFRLLGKISRINRYGDTSACVNDADMRKYCYCNGLLTPLKCAICNFIHCI